MRKWADKVLWLVIGAVVIGSLMAISTSPAVAQYDNERLSAIERRLNAIEERFRQMDKAAADAAKERPPVIQIGVELGIRINKLSEQGKGRDSRAGRVSSVPFCHIQGYATA